MLATRLLGDEDTPSWQQGHTLLATRTRLLGNGDTPSQHLYTLSEELLDRSRQRRDSYQRIKNPSEQLESTFSAIQKTTTLATLEPFSAPSQQPRLQEASSERLFSCNRGTFLSNSRKAFHQHRNPSHLPPWRPRFSPTHGPIATTRGRFSPTWKALLSKPLPGTGNPFCRGCPRFHHRNRV